MNCNSNLVLVLGVICGGLTTLANGITDGCNHDGIRPIDYCYDQHIDEVHGDSHSYLLKCRFDDANNKWFVDELEYSESAECKGNEYKTIKSTECLEANNCICGDSSNDCIDDKHQVLFTLVNGKKDTNTGLCSYIEADAETQFIYDASFGVDCEGQEFMERTDTCQRIYCNADNKLIAVPENPTRRRMFIWLVPLFTITASGWGQYCNSNPNGSICP